MQLCIYKIINVHLQYFDEFSAPRHIMPMIVSICERCDEQQSFSVVKLDLFIRALLLDHILALKTTMHSPCLYLVKNWKPTSFGYFVNTGSLGCLLDISNYVSPHMKAV